MNKTMVQAGLAELVGADRAPSSQDKEGQALQVWRWLPGVPQAQQIGREAVALGQLVQGQGGQLPDPLAHHLKGQLERGAIDQLVSQEVSLEAVVGQEIARLQGESALLSLVEQAVVENGLHISFSFRI